MFFGKIKDKIRSAVKTIRDIDNSMFYHNDDGNYSINAEIARNNYNAYQHSLKQREQEFIEKWCKDISRISSIGRKSIDITFGVADDGDRIFYVIDELFAYDFPTDSSIQYFKEYFENKGFNVTKINGPDNLYTLRISWLD